MICDEIVSWASTCRCVSKQSPKTYSAGRKTPSYSKNRATNCDLQWNRLLGISVLMCIKIVPKNVLNASKNPQGQSKPSYELWFATKSSSGHQRVEVHRNSPQKRTQKVEIQKLLKNVLSGSKKPKIHSYSRYKLLFATKSFPGHQRVEVHWNSPQKRTQRVEKPPVTVKTELQIMICDKIVFWASACRGTSK